jgi:hypothetical protein
VSQQRLVAYQQAPLGAALMLVAEKYTGLAALLSVCLPLQSSGAWLLSCMPVFLRSPVAPGCRCVGYWLVDRLRCRAAVFIYSICIRARPKRIDAGLSVYQPSVPSPTTKCMYCQCAKFGCSQRAVLAEASKCKQAGFRRVKVAKACRATPQSADWLQHNSSDLAKQYSNYNKGSSTGCQGRSKAHPRVQWHKFIV